MEELLRRLVGTVETVRLGSATIVVDGGTTSEADVVDIDVVNGDLRIQLDVTQGLGFCLKTADGTELEPDSDNCITIPQRTCETVTQTIDSSGNVTFNFTNDYGDRDVIVVPRLDGSSGGASIQFVSQNATSATFNFTNVTTSFPFTVQVLEC